MTIAQNSLVVRSIKKKKLSYLLQEVFSIRKDLGRIGNTWKDLGRLGKAGKDWKRLGRPLLFCYFMI